MDVRSSKPKTGLKGTIEIPSDKSISHRAALFSVLTKGVTKISNFSKGEDCLSSLRIIEQLGCKTWFEDDSTLIIDSTQAPKAPSAPLDCGNSGTTMRLVSGMLAGQEFNSTLIGDESLSKRPMRRVIEPLSLMGAEIVHGDFKAPLEIKGKPLQAIEYDSKLASAQVKSCVLLAGLFAQGVTVFKEPYLSRNHTELLLEYMGASVIAEGTTVSIKPSVLHPIDVTVPGDISSATFFMVAACIVPGSCVTLKNIGVNPTRTGIIDVLTDMGADIKLENQRMFGKEPVADITVSYSSLRAIDIGADIIPRLIDELPIIAVLATQASGVTTISGAQDLRHKESDRISSLVTELKKIGANIEEAPDGFIVSPSKLHGDAILECYHDHRLAMTFFVAGLICSEPLVISEFQWVNISFPEFLDTIKNLSS